MSRVPRIRFKGFEEDWEQRKLGEVIQERNIRTSDFDKFPIFSLTIESGVTPKTERYERSSLVTKTEDLFKVVKPNEFVTNPMNLRFGALGYNTQKYDISVSGYYDVFSIDGNNCSGFWNAYFKTQQVMNIFDNLATGSLVEKKRVKYSTLKQIYVSVPSAIEEKNKISKFMSFTDHLITLHQRKLEKLKIIKKSMLENLFPQNGEKTPKIRFSGFTEDWEQRKWIDVVDISKDMVDPQNGKYDNLPHISPGNIESFTGQLYDNVKCVKDENLISGKFKFSSGDIIYGKINPQLGKYLYATFSGLTSADAYVLNAKNNVIQKYLYTIIQTRNFFEYSVSVSMRSGMPKINRDELNVYSFFAPLIEEQLKIGNCILKYDHLITLHQSKLEKLQKIKKSMLESMFV